MAEHTRLTFGSLFSGIGGIDLGLERAGWQCRWQVELDPFCQQVLAKHWPDVPRYGDIKELNTDELERVHLVAGGPPCQPVSLAGAQRGQDDERWLWDHYCRVLRDLRPRLALMENPTGLVSRHMGVVLGLLAEVGFDAEWGVLSACFVGAPHARERVFIVAYPAGTGLEGGVLAQAAWPAQRVPSGEHRWATRDDVARKAHGFPGWVDEHRALGNSVVPQLAELIGERLKAVA